MRFHINRIIELTHSLNKGFPLVNFKTFNGIGYDVNSFYPSMSVYLISPIFLIKNPVNAYYILLMLLLFLTQVCSYISGRSLKMRKESAVLFAIFYTFSEYMWFVFLYAFELGEILAFIAFPLILTSIISYTHPKYVDEKFLRYREGIFLLSFVWVTYSHILSAIICLLITIPFLLFNVFRYKKWNLLKQYVIIGFSYSLATSFFWVNLLHEYLFNGIVGPEKYLDVSSAQQLVTNSLENKLATGNGDPFQSVGVGVILLIAALILITNFHKLNKLEKALTVSAGIFFVLSSNLFCWETLDIHVKSLETIQYTFRFLILVVLTLSLAISLFYKGKVKVVICFVICIALFNINASQHFVNMGQEQDEFTTKPLFRKEPKYANIKVNKETFKYLYQGFYGIKGGPGDYLTKKQKQYFNTIARHEVLFNGRRVKSAHTEDTNSITYKFYLSKDGTIDLPILKTNHQYQATDNGNRICYKVSKRGTLSINRLRKGRHVINVRVVPSALFMFSIALSIIGVLPTIFKFIKIYRNR